MKGRGPSHPWFLWPRFSARAWVVWRRNWLAWRYHMGTSIVANLSNPVLSLLALGLGVGMFVSDIGGMSFVEFIGPGLLVGSAMTSITFDVCYGVFDRLHWTRAYHAMINSPLLTEEVVAGEILWQMTRTLFFSTGFLVVLSLFGLLSSWWGLLLPLVATLASVVFTGPAIAVASVARTEEQLTYYFNLVIQPMFFFAGVFFPVEALGAAVERVAQFLPLYHAVALARAFAAGAPPAEALAVHGAWLLLFSAIALLIPSPFLRRALERVQ